MAVVWPSSGITAARSNLENDQLSEQSVRGEEKDSTLTDETARRFRIAKLPCEREPAAIRV